MKLEVSIEELQKNKIMIATPMYGGQCFGVYAKSCIDLANKCSNYKIPIKFHYLFNESLITRARNYLVDEFLRSDFTHLVFIDADINFNPNDVLALVALDKDIVAGPYPKKTIAWEKVAEAVRSGLVDDDIMSLSKYSGDFVFNPVPGTKSFAIGEPVEVLEAGTGFMAIKRETLEKFQEAYPDLKYKPDHARTTNFDGSRDIHAFFDTVIDPESRRYLSEDYMFCQYARHIGLEVWMCPWMELSHIGTHIFDSNVKSLAKLGNVNPTGINYKDNDSVKESLKKAGR